jgi:hypothetical protein
MDAMRTCSACVLGAIIVACLRDHPTPLGLLLASAPVLGVLAVPPGWWQSRSGLAAVAATLALAAWLVYQPSIALMRQYQAQLEPLHFLRQWWCAGGLGLIALGTTARLAALDAPWWLRGALAVGFLVAGVAAALPLPPIFRPHLTADDDAKVLAIATTTELAITGADGVLLHARLYQPRRGPAVGVVVFTHGVGGWKEGFLNHLWVLSDAGWAVLSYDLRGCGRSSAAAITYGTREADDLVRVWAEARTIAAGRPLVAAGASMGAAVTLLAAHRLEGCAGLIIESPYADLGAMLRRSFSSPVAGLAGAIARLGLGWDPEAVRPVAAPVLAAGPPLLIGWIADDTTIPASESAAVAAAAPRARTLVMDHGAHLDLIVHEPWRAAVRALLAEAAAQRQ